jgi:hypothetical protein
VSKKEKLIKKYFGINDRGAEMSNILEYKGHIGRVEFFPPKIRYFTGRLSSLTTWSLLKQRR